MCDEHEFSHAIIVSLLFAMSLAPHLPRRRLRFNEASGNSSAGVGIVVFKVQSTVAFVLKLQDSLNWDCMKMEVMEGLSRMKFNQTFTVTCTMVQLKQAN